MAEPARKLEPDDEINIRNADQSNSSTVPPPDNVIELESRRKTIDRIKTTDRREAGVVVDLFSKKTKTTTKKQPVSNSNSGASEAARVVNSGGTEQPQGTFSQLVKPNSVYDENQPNDTLIDGTPDEETETEGDDTEDVAKKESDADEQDGQDTSTTKEEDKLNEDDDNEEDDDEDEASQRWYNKVAKKKSRKKLIMWFGVAGAAVSILGTVAFLPTFLTRQMMSRLNSAFNDRVDYALQVRTERYLDTYLGRLVTKTNTQCGYIVTSECGTSQPGGFTARVFDTWQKTNMETKLLDRHGIEFRTDTRTGRTTIFQNGEEVLEAGRRTILRDATDLINTETRWRRIVDRRHLRSLLVREHGATRWTVLPREADRRIDDNALARYNRVQLLKLRLASRVSDFVGAKSSAYLLCFISNCNELETITEGNKAGREALQKIGNETLEEIAEKIGNRTAGQYLVQAGTAKVLEKVFNFSAQRAGQAAASGVPVAGQIYLFATILDMLHEVDLKIEGGEISRYAQRLREDAYIQYWEAFALLAEDVQSNDSSLADAGAVASLLYGFNASRVYQSINDVENKTQVECEDGVVLTPTDTRLICPEYSVNPGSLKLEQAWGIIKSTNPQIDGALTAYRSCVIGVDLGIAEACAPGGRANQIVGAALDGINWVIGGVSNTALSALETTLSVLPGFGSITSLVNDALGASAGWVFERTSEFLFPSIINTAAEGAQALDQIAAGLDVVANKFLAGSTNENGEDPIGLGAPRITPQEQAELQIAINERRKEELSQQSIFARYFDVNNPNSLLANTLFRVGSAMPNYSQGLNVSINPLSIFSNAPQLFGAQTVGAIDDVQDRSEIFGVTQYGFPVNDIAMTINPDDLTPARCAEFAQARETEGTGYFIDEESGRKVYLVSDPCMLDELVVDSLTKAFNLDGAATSAAGVEETAIDQEAEVIP